MTAHRGFQDTKPIGITSDNCPRLRELNLLQSKSILSVWSGAWSKLFCQLRPGFLSTETSHFASEGSLGVSEHIYSINDERIRCWQKTGSWSMWQWRCRSLTGACFIRGKGIIYTWKWPTFGTWYSQCFLSLNTDTQFSAVELVSKGLYWRLSYKSLFTLNRVTA